MLNNPNHNRLAILQATPNILVDMCKPDFPFAGVSVIQNALPDDAEIERTHVNADDQIEIVLSSATFAEVAAGDAIPILEPPVFQRTTDAQ